MMEGPDGTSWEIQFLRIEHSIVLLHPLRGLIVHVLLLLKLHFIFFIATFH